MHRIVIASIAMAGIASPAIAADRAAENAKEDKVVCKRVQDTSTGSHFPVGRKTCMKRSEWKELADGVDRVMRDVGESRPDLTTAPSGMSGAPQ